MNNEQFKRELNYQVARYFVREMHKKGIISDDDLQKWQAILVEKYQPPLGGWYQKRINNPA